MRHHPIHLLWVVAVLLVAWRLAHDVVPASGRLTNGFSAYYTGARLALDGQATSRIYDDVWFWGQTIRLGFRDAPDIFNLNPPAATLLLAPLAAPDPRRTKTLWTLLNLAFLAVGLVGLARVGRLRPADVALGVILLAGFQPVREELALGQAYALLFALEVGVAGALVGGRFGLAGAVLGVMLGIKSAGLLVPGLFVGARRLSGMAGLALGLLLTVAVSLVGTSPGAWLTYVGLLAQPGRHPELAVTAYQSLPGLWLHLFRRDPRWNPTPLADAPTLAVGLVAASLALPIATTLFLTWRDPLKSASRRSLAFAAWSSLSLVLGPASADYHYVLLLAPIALLWASRGALARRRPGVALLALAVVLVGAPLPITSPRLAAGAWAVLAYPKLYGGLLVWALALAGLLPSDRRAGRPAGDVRGATVPA